MHTIDSRKASYITAIILAAFVVLPNAISIWLERVIKKYESAKIETLIKRSQYMQREGYFDAKISYYELQGVLTDLAPPTKKLVITPNPILQGDRKYKTLEKRYAAGELIARQYITELGNLSREEEAYFRERVHKMGEKLDDMERHPPLAGRIKPWFAVLQCVAVGLVVLINGRVVSHG